MKLYRRNLKVTDKEEMHLQVDHYMEPIPTVDESRIDQLWYDHGGVERHSELLNLMDKDDFKNAIKAVLQLTTEK